MGNLIVDRNRLNLSWLVRLRWSSIAGQLATILGVHWVLAIVLPLPQLFFIVGLEAVSNIGCGLWLERNREVREWHLAVVMALDVTLLTGLLFFTGGPSNPFSFLYLVPIALAAVVLHKYWTWALVALSFGAMGLLLLGHRDLAIAQMDAVGTHQRGMWVALGVAAAFIVHFLLRITGALAERERELSEARKLAAQRQRLASLATMAAGAAHELATPLGTIALVAKELERHLTKQGQGSALLVEDAQLIREQVGRCRIILDQMGAEKGAGESEHAREITIGALLADAMTGLRNAPTVELSWNAPVSKTVVRMPSRAVAQALRNVITNAQDASPDDRVVVVAASASDGRVHIEVRDRGDGMPPALLSRVGEPFFTTKTPGHGMGLGLFLTRTVLERVGGQLTIESRPGEGTRVAFTLPIDGGAALAALSSVPPS